MALYRTISLSFWTDTKVADDFTPEDRYFYLYLITNPHTNLCGCYEISIKQIADETGYSKETIERLLARFSEIHKVTDYSQETKEVLLINWHKYSWTTSPKFRKPLLVEIKDVKNEKFKAYLMELFNGNPTRYPIDTYCIDTSVTVADAVTDTVTDTVTVTNTKKEEKKKDKTPYQEVLDMYHSLCPSLPTVRTYTDKRKKGVKARLETYSLNDIKEAFIKAETSSFMRGENDRKWKPDFEWFFIHGDNNIAKVLEGKYDDAPKASSTGYDPAIFERLANERREDID